MTDAVQILGHPLFAGAAGLAALVAAALLVDRGRVRASLAVGAAAAVLMAVALAAGRGAATTPDVAPALAQEQDCGEAVVRRASLVLHTEPADTAPAITRLRQGERVQLACVNADLAGAGIKWTRVRYGIWEGWVAERVQAGEGATQIYLERLPPSTLHSAR